MTRLLIIKPSSLGDIIHGLQLAATLKTVSPELRIDWVARDLFAPLVERATCVDRVYVFRRRAGLGAFGGLLRELRRTEYDAVFDLQGLMRTAIMTMAVRSPRKVGRADAREGARFVYGRTVALPAEGKRSHALDILLQFCRELGHPPQLSGRLEFRRAPAPAGARVPPGAIVLFPESRRPEKCWPHFAELTRELVGRSSAAPVVWAGADRLEFSPGRHSERFVNLTGETSLAELPELIGAAALVVSNDSGPMHLAAALKVPVLGLFGPTDPQRFGPYPVGSDRTQVLRAPAGRLADLAPMVVVEHIRTRLTAG